MFTEPEYKKVEEMVRRGCGPEEIAAELGIDRTTLDRRMANQRGVKIVSKRTWRIEPIGSSTRELTPA